jgi:RNA polymerase sigma-70 factor, ECF subfamily
METKITNEELSLLVEKAQKRDHHAFQQLYENYQARVCARVYSMIKQADLLQDITQDVWLSVFLALPSLRNTAAFPTWLFRIATHKTWKMAKQHSLECQFLSLEAYDDEILLLTDANDPAEILLRYEQTCLVYTFLSRLTFKEREVLIPFYIEQLPMAVIASQLSLSISAIKSRLFQARKRLLLIASQGE